MTLELSKSVLKHFTHEVYRTPWWNVRHLLLAIAENDSCALTNGEIESLIRTAVAIGTPQFWESLEVEPNWTSILEAQYGSDIIGMIRRLGLVTKLSVSDVEAMIHFLWPGGVARTVRRIENVNIEEFSKLSETVKTFLLDKKVVTL